MKEKLSASGSKWSDPDDAPEINEAFLRQAEFRVGDLPVSSESGLQAFGKALRRGRPKSVVTKQSLTVRYDADVIAAFKATGRGWQSRMNDALREWLKLHLPSSR